MSDAGRDEDQPARTDGTDDDAREFPPSRRVQNDAQAACTPSLRGWPARRRPPWDDLQDVSLHWLSAVHRNHS
jgi:hypothetical protein